MATCKAIYYSLKALTLFTQDPYRIHKLPPVCANHTGFLAGIITSDKSKEHLPMYTPAYLAFLSGRAHVAHVTDTESEGSVGITKELPGTKMTPKARFATQHKNLVTVSSAGLVRGIT